MMLRLLGRALATLAMMSTALAGSAWAGSGQACACSCMQLSSEELVAGADAVVIGRAVAKYDDDNHRRYVFEVKQSYKTRVNHTIVIHTAAQGPSCGLDLELGATRAVVLGKSSEKNWVGAPAGSWSSSSCAALSAPDTSADMPAAAGAPIAPTAGPSAEVLLLGVRFMTNDAAVALTRSPWVVVSWAVGGVVVVGAGVLLAARRYRRTGW